MTGATYEAGALIAAERKSEQMWTLHRRMLERGIRPTIPSPALAQAWRGGRQARVARLLNGCQVASFTDSDARATGKALAMSGTTDVVDAAVVVGAATRGDVVVTSDPKDLKRIADAIGTRLLLRVV